MIWREIGEYQQPEYFPHSGRLIKFGYVSVKAVIYPAILTLEKSGNKTLTIQDMGELHYDPKTGWNGELSNTILTAEAVEMASK